MRRQARLALASLLIASLATVACGPSEEERAAAELAKKTQDAYAAMEAAKGPLDAKRAELKAARAALDAAGTNPAADLFAKVEAIEKETYPMAEALSAKATEFINTSEITEGAPLTPEQRKAFDYLAEEAIVIGQEYIEKGGDYRKAIEIYGNQLGADKDNPKLLAAKAEAEKLRYMTAERFAAAKKGMTQYEIKKLLGAVKGLNSREFKEQGRVGWYYPKEDGGAAGVFFKEKAGVWIVEVLQFDAVKAGEKN